jgi:hypothetical protein
MQEGINGNAQQENQRDHHELRPKLQASNHVAMLLHRYTFQVRET